jgi:ribosomal 30S subunit maturation factor RimM
MPEDDTILIGRIGRAHGIRGQVIVHPDTDFSEQRFREGGELLYRKSKVSHRVSLVYRECL